MHPESRGSVALRSSDPAAPPVIRPNWLATESDRGASIAVLRRMRELLASPALAPYRGPELAPGPEVRSDAEILQAYARFGSTANHAVGTCAMGSTASAVLDERLRVRGIENLRVIDCSSIPALPSGNTNAPVMALAWRAADLIEQEIHARQPAPALAQAS
jgi:choline dehydrogenase-like flavoprotein